MYNSTTNYTITEYNLLVEFSKTAWLNLGAFLPNLKVKCDIFQTLHVRVPGRELENLFLF